ncbi:MAG: EamA family transporter [Clostridiales bacterium]|nr:EamA family transporter [Clostridiales bacterium]
MMNEKLIFSGIYLCSVLIASISQILLKTSANKTYNSKIKEYMNPRVITAYGLFLASSFITVIAYRHVPLSMGAILESMGYLFVTVLGVFFLKETVKGKKLAGLFLIILGVMIYSF